MKQDMKSLKLYWVDSFTDKPFCGNPVVIVVNADSISDDEKQLIAKEMNVSETVFVSKSQIADFKVQFFTPKQETVLCGHGTIATFWLLSMIGKIKNQSDDIITVKQETKAGVLPVEISFDKNKTINKVMMHQILPEFYNNDIDINKIADILGISLNDFDQHYPLKIVSTGRPKLFIPIINKDILYCIKPNFDKMLDYCVQQSITGFHLFTFDTHNVNSITTARHFAPIAGINEDPVTGIAAGALGCYLSEFGKDKSTLVNYQMEQGFNMGRNGIIDVEISKNNQLYNYVKVGGKAHILFNSNISIIKS